MRKIVKRSSVLGIVVFVVGFFLLPNTEAQTPRGEPFESLRDAIENESSSRIEADAEINARIDELDSRGCPQAMVQVGDICVDTYEASVWSTPTGGIQYGDEEAEFPPPPCQPDGRGCTEIYARSVAGVLPSTWMTWFQAQQACANVGKRLLTNAEWQTAAADTPLGSGICIYGFGLPGKELTGTGVETPGDPTDDCVSRWGVFDMVGNVGEMVSDWYDNEDNGFPSGSGNARDFYAFTRGGAWISSSTSVFSVGGVNTLSHGFDLLGFRCAMVAQGASK